MSAASPSGRLLRADFAERAYLTIRERILRGQLPLGGVLSRRQIARDLGVSPLPVAEAIQRLEADGLLESRPQVGTRVRIPTEQDIRDRFVIREALESQAARLFCERATPEQRTGLRRMAERVDELNTRCFSDECDAEFVFAVHSYHSHFHMRIAEHSGCAGLKDLIEKNSVLILNWAYDLQSTQPQYPSRFHRDLTAALTATDPGEADAAMRGHVRFGIEETVSYMREFQKDSGGKWRVRGLSSGPRKPRKREKK